MRALGLISLLTTSTTLPALSRTLIDRQDQHDESLGQRGLSPCSQLRGRCSVGVGQALDQPFGLGFTRCIKDRPNIGGDLTLRGFTGHIRLGILLHLQLEPTPPPAAEGA